MTRLLRRWGPWAALVIVLAAVLAIGATRADEHQSVQQETLSLAGRVRCPVCQGESAAESDTPAAASIRQRIHDDLSAGQSSTQILHSLVGSYGPGILEDPPASGIALWAWVTPVAVAVVAALGLVLGFRHWRRPRAAAPAPGRSPAGVSAEDEVLVREALAARAGADRQQ